MVKVKVMKDSDHIEAVVSRTLETLQKVYDSQQEKFKGSKLPITESRLIFPIKRDKSTRISEQELRFIFVEQLNREINEGWNVYYSVETPTSEPYCFTGKKKESGCIDLVIHNAKFQRIAVIEFKAHNRGSAEKDFIKLSNPKEDGKYRYFISLLKNVSGSTPGNIHKKIKEYLNYGIIFKFYSLGSKGRKDITDDIINYQS